MDRKVQRQTWTRRATSAATTPGGGNFSYGDGSIRYLRETTDEIVYNAIATIAGGEVATAD